MNFDFEQFGFSLETTLDGSPTLRLIAGPINSDKPPESMHHSGGAASETLYIYGNPMCKAMQLAHERSQSALKTCVVGLGLGYIEMCWADAQIKSKTAGSCDSFEIIEGLKKNFLNWLSSNKTTIYNECLNYLKVDSSSKVYEKMQHNFLNEEHLYKDLIDKKSYQDKKWNLICYDAFSRKTNQELWQEDFLTDWIFHHAEEDAVFMTYACTGSLKRALQKNNFTFIKRPGFQGKRDATLALRGIYKDLDLNLLT